MKLGKLVPIIRSATPYLTTAGAGIGIAIIPELAHAGIAPLPVFTSVVNALVAGSSGLAGVLGMHTIAKVAIAANRHQTDMIYDITAGAKGPAVLAAGPALLGPAGLNLGMVAYWLC